MTAPGVRRTPQEGAGEQGGGQGEDSESRHPSTLPTIRRSCPEVPAYDVVEVWRGYADQVRGHQVGGGHFLPEEAPRETLAALREFLGEPGT